MNLSPLLKTMSLIWLFVVVSDGLDCCRQIIRDACRALAPGGWILLEHHHDQSAMVLKLLSDAGLERPEARYDLQGIPRFALAQRSCESIASNQQTDER
jgi:release factor glutamine methyltransferase